MNKAFWTERKDHPKPPSIPKGGDFRNYRGEVAKWLIVFGIPLQTTELAIIDLQVELGRLYKEKITAERSAANIFEDVKRIYKVA